MKLEAFMGLVQLTRFLLPLDCASGDDFKNKVLRRTEEIASCIKKYDEDFSKNMLDSSYFKISKTALENFLKSNY